MFEGDSTGLNATPRPQGPAAASLRVLSLFSGIGGFDLALERAGMTVVCQVEIDPYCNEVLARHWPHVRRIADVRDVGTSSDITSADQRRNGSGLADSYGRIDLICGGFPCQDLSVAGKRAGLDGARSGLWFEFQRIMSELRPRWAVIENVPGLLCGCGCAICECVRVRIRSHREGRGGDCRCPECGAGEGLLAAHSGHNFGIVLAGLEECGFAGVSWAILDSRYWGVPQRRRRVFIVCGPSRRHTETVLSLCEGCGGHPATGGEERPGVAFGAPNGLARSLSNTGGGNDYGANKGTLTYIPEVVPQAISSKWAKQSSGPAGDEIAHLVAHSLRAEGFDASEDGTGRGTPLAFVASEQMNSYYSESDQSYTLNAQPPNDTSNIQYGIYQGATVRRLTPVECCRLQGFPDDWLHGADGPRYRALGNAVTVPVVEWIGLRIMALEAARG